MKRFWHCLKVLKMKRLTLLLFFVLSQIVAVCAQSNGVTVVPRPERIVALSKIRGEQDSAKPVLRIIEPSMDAVIDRSTVTVKLEISGDLKGYMPMMDPATKSGNHIHVILDNQPYEAHYNLGSGFELRNVADGEHTLRVFPSRPWHESYKNAGAFQFVRFTVKGGAADVSRPTVTGGGQQMSAGIEGKAMQASVAGKVRWGSPLLTFSRPKGEYRNGDADAIMVDFWLANARLVGDGGTYRVKMTINGGQPMYLERWEPVWLTGWVTGKNRIALELVDKKGRTVDNGGYNQTLREFIVTR